MIAWMSEETNRVIDKFGLAVYGYHCDNADDARMKVERGDDCFLLILGDVRHLTPYEINRRFYAAIRGIDALSDVCDELREQFRKGDAA